jgi:hypothetical protein
MMLIKYMCKHYGNRTIPLIQMPSLLATSAVYATMAAAQHFTFATTTAGATTTVTMLLLLL